MNAVVDVDAHGVVLGIEILGLLSKHLHLTGDDRRTPLYPGMEEEEARPDDPRPAIRG